MVSKSSFISSELTSGGEEVNSSSALRYALACSTAFKACSKRASPEVVCSVTGKFSEARSAIFCSIQRTVAYLLDNLLLCQG